MTSQAAPVPVVVHDRWRATCRRLAAGCALPVQADAEHILARRRAAHAQGLLAEWTRERLSISPEDGAARRAFDTVESLIKDERLKLGDALAAEFIEGIWDHPGADALMGPQTRQRAQPG